MPTPTDMHYESPLALALAWQDAANRQDVEQLLALSSPTIAIIGPRGTGQGHQLLRDWLGRAGAYLTTLRAFARDEHVVLVQHGVWHAAETGGVRGEADIVSHFHIDNQQVSVFARYERLASALAAAGLQYEDEIALPKEG